MSESTIAQTVTDYESAFTTIAARIDECVSKSKTNIEKNKHRHKNEDGYEEPPLTKLQEASSDMNCYALRCRNDIRKCVMDSCPN
jgi:hypothetical protein